MSWESLINTESVVSFDAISGQATFSYVFPERTELTGYFKLRLWVQAKGNDDMDIFTKFSKLSIDDELVESTCIDVGYMSENPAAERAKALEMHAKGDNLMDIYFAEGGHGRLRASHRELDETKSTSHQPYHAHTQIKKLREGEIVPLEIEIWPHAMIWEAGEKIRLSVAGHNLRPELTTRTPTVKTLNQGEILIHTGGKYDSYLLVPYIPEQRT
jgi:predicted acyl esterase